MKEIPAKKHAVSVRDLEVNLRGRTVLKGLDISFEKGKLYGVLGPNGAGKSTFIKTVARILENYSGKIVFLGEDLKKFSLKSLGKLRGYLAQRETITGELTVIETILFGRIPHTGILKNGMDLKIVNELIERLGLNHLAKRKLSEISGGELQKVLLARALAQRPKVLLLDEPINHLDPRNQIEILNFLQRETKNSELITVIVLHDVNLALRFCDNIVILKDGKIYFSGSPEEIHEKILSEVYGVDAKIITDGGKKIVLFYFEKGAE